MCKTGFRLQKLKNNIFIITLHHVTASKLRLVALKLCDAFSWDHYKWICKTMDNSNLQLFLLWFSISQQKIVCLRLYFLLRAWMASLFDCWPVIRWRLLPLLLWGNDTNLHQQIYFCPISWLSVSSEGVTSLQSESGPCGVQVFWGLSASLLLLFLSKPEAHQ